MPSNKPTPSHAPDLSSLKPLLRVPTHHLGEIVLQFAHTLLRDDKSHLRNLPETSKSWFHTTLPNPGTTYSQTYSPTIWQCALFGALLLLKRYYGIWGPEEGRLTYSSENAIAKVAAAMQVSLAQISGTKPDTAAWSAHFQVDLQLLRKFSHELINGFDGDTRIERKYLELFMGDVIREYESAKGKGNFSTIVRGNELGRSKYGGPTRAEVLNRVYSTPQRK
ncbi:hypothetical protein DFP72DRAFT_853812 [Ephemerocybe angulata]|uniref:Uncharacterized protein n=1 Tax=Ephemerocybe angulata TaxID=980116 RepID=A0A8H6HJG3_9AGAR|nr:hypothetical protein DFP72DRAFT_853812 [Tulosesus angulatus]